MYLSKADRCRIAEIVEILAEELIDVLKRVMEQLSTTEQERKDREDRCIRTANEWLW